MTRLMEVLHMAYRQDNTNDESDLRESEISGSRKRRGIVVPASEFAALLPVGPGADPPGCSRNHNATVKR